MYALGFTINTLTLLAMVLAIGLVVDDAIVVLENIYRHIEDGMQPVPAAIEGTREIGFAVIAMTLTLAAVYAPIAFAPGRTGRLFLEFALALAGAVVVSGFVALTLTPMMCSKLLRHNPNPGRIFNLIERGFTAFERGYRRAAAWPRLRPAPDRCSAGALGVAGLSGLFFMRSSSPSWRRRRTAACSRCAAPARKERRCAYTQPLQQPGGRASWPRCRRSNRR